MDVDAEIHSQDPGWVGGIKFQRGRRDYTSNRRVETRSWWRHPQRQLIPTPGSSWTRYWKMGVLHETEVGLLNVGNSCVAWFVWPLAEELGSIPGAWSDFLKHIPYSGRPCSAGVGTCSCLNLICQDLLNSQVETWSFLRGGLEWCRGKMGWENGRERDLGLVCKMNKK